MTPGPDPLVGSIVADRYEIVSLINVGGMGIVYRARQRSLDRLVAIKFIHPQLLRSEASFRRFLDEARAVSRMNHPHVVSVFDFGQTPENEGGYPFLVMELLTGPDLAKELARERLLPLPRVADIVLQALEALAEAHHLGIVHRDMKPENIVLEMARDGHDHVKVIDFGIAKMGDARRLTDAGMVCGTPSYMAPEQLTGVAGPSADVFSMGVLLFELLTGKLPTNGDATAGSSGGWVRHDPRRVAPHRGIPEGLASACLRAIQADPGQRFADAQAFANAIRRAMSGFSAAGVPAVCAPQPPFPPRQALSAALPASTLPERTTTRLDGPGASAVIPIAWASSRMRAVLHGSGRSSPPGSGAPFGGPVSVEAMASPSSSPSPKTRSEPGRLVGRRGDLQWAGELLGAEQAPPAIAFWGRPGVGKTRLANEVAANAEQGGALLLSVALSPQPCGEVGYLGLRRIVRGLSGLSPAEMLDDRTVGPLDRWSLMGLRMLFSRARAPAEPNMARRTAAAALGWAMWRAAERAPRGRVLLVLDDMDRLDGASLLALRDRMQAEPIPGVTVLVTSEHARTIVLLSGIRERALRGLTYASAVEMLADLRQDAVLTRSDDDIEPLHVAQVAACCRAPDPVPQDALEGAVAWHMQGLTLGQRRILQALAIVGFQNVENLGLLLRHPGDLHGALAQLEADGWIEQNAGQVSLRHVVYGQVALTDAPAAAVAAIHKVAAHLLRETRDLGELRAFHAIRGAADFEAFVLLEEVARLRSERGDHDGAIAALAAAVREARSQVTPGENGAASAALGVFGRKLATALVTAERFDEAQNVLLEVLDVADPKGRTRAAVLEQLGLVAALRGRSGDAEQRRREALAVAEHTDDQQLKERLREPMTVTEEDPAGTTSDSRDGTQAAPESAATPVHAPRRPVLVVDDDRSIREGIQSVLESEGHQAFGAANGREALEVLRRIPRPGLILLDLMMPVMNGWELLEALRADADFATIPVVVVSAVSERRKVDASRVLRKPVAVGTLLGVVEELCG